MLWTINDMVRTSLFHASLPSSFWVYDLELYTYLLNILPTKTLHNQTSTHSLYLRPSSYDHLRVLGCSWFPNIFTTTPHKLTPRSTSCLFLGYLANHRGYYCLELFSNKIIIFRHVVFDESTFPFNNLAHFRKSDYDFLEFNLLTLLLLSPIIFISRPTNLSS